MPFGPWPGRGGGAGGGSIIITGLDTSGMPASGLFAYEGPGKQALPTDNYVARAANAIALWNGSQLVVAGTAQTVQMTTDGGKPALGQPIYLAASADDGATGSGKGTATPPLWTVPLLVYPDVNWPRNPTVVGTCIDNSLYDSAKTVRVQVALPTPPLPVAPPGQPVNQPNEVFVGARVGGFSGSTHNITADGNNAEITMYLDRTIAVLFDVTDFTKLTGSDYIYEHSDAAGTNGFFMFCTAGNHLLVQSWSGGVQVAGVDLGPVQLGLNCVVATTVTEADAIGNLQASLNGGNVVSGAFGGTPAAEAPGWNLTLGGFTGINVPFAGGDIYAVHKIKRPATLDELAAWSDVHPAPPHDRFFLSPALTTSQYVEWYWRVSDWITSAEPVATAGPLGTAFDFTVNPSLVAGPQRTDVNEEWFAASSQAITIDSAPSFYDSRGNPQSDPGARIVFTLPAVNAELCIGATNDDLDNVDNGAPIVFCDGVSLGTLVLQADGEVNYQWFRMPQPTVADHLIEIVTPDKQQREFTGGLLKSGTCVKEVVAAANQVFTGPATANRLVLVGDGTDIGHDAGTGSCPMTASLGTQLRSDYPGRVTLHSATARGLQPMFDLYGGNAGAMGRFAKEIVEAGQEGSPAAVTVWILIGYYDYATPFCTVAQYSSHYAQLVDALHAQQPTWNIYASNLIASFFDAVANTNGETMNDFNVAIAALATGRPWLHVVNARVPNAITFTSTHFQPDQPAGAGAWKANIKLILGY